MNPQLERLRQAFLDDFGAELDPLLGRLTRAYQTQANARETLKEAGDFFHRLSGVAGTFGLSLLGHMAAIVDSVVDLQLDAAGTSRMLEIVMHAVETTQEVLREASAPGPDPALVELSERVAKKPVDDNAPLSTIAIVDDDRLSGELIESCLISAGYQTVLLRQPDSAVEELSQRLPDLILLDVAMPGLDGFQLCEQLRQNGALSLVPIIFVTAKNDTAQKVRGLTVGGNDYIEKPFSPDELIARVAAHLERLRTIRELAIRDSLTGVFNHKYFETLLDQEVKRASRYGLPLSLGILDIDHFKSINDKHGHLVGDSVLTRFVQTITGQLRNSDVVGRWGGDEFAVILTQTPLLGASGVMKRVVLAVSNVVAGEPPTRVSTSIGLTEFRSGDDLHTLVTRADAALYRAKANGRGRLEVSQEADTKAGL